MVDSGFADRLALSIHNKRLTQAKVAAALGVSPGTVSRWMAGRVPRKIVLAAIVDFLGVDADWLRDGTGRAGMLSALSLPDWQLVPAEFRAHPESFSDAQAWKFINDANEKKRRGFGQRIRKLRGELGLGLRGFAVLCGVTAGYLSRIERGENSNPSDQMLDNIMTALRVTRRWLVYGDPPILQSAEGCKGLDARFLGKIRELERREKAVYNEDRERFIRKLVADKKVGTAAMILSIEHKKEIAAQNEDARRVQELMAEILQARATDDGGGKKSSK